MSINFPNIHWPEATKLAKSAAICAIALGSVLLLKRFFPEFDYVQLQTAILTVVSAWLVNVVKESTK